MGSALFPKFEAQVRAADQILGYSVVELCTEDREQRLNDTRFTQPALYVVSALTFLGLRGSSSPRYLAGHSLGEYAALFAAEAFDFETGLLLVKRRAEAMSACKAGSMAAVIGADTAVVQALLEEAGLGELDIANYNAPDQHVLAGPEVALQRAKPVFKSRGYGYARLNVSGPFHSRYMQAAKQAFARAVSEVTFAEPKTPVVANVTARPHEARNLAACLTSQMDSAVRWNDSMRYLLAQGAREFVEVGPGTTLTKLLGAIAGTGAAATLPNSKEEGRTC